MAATLLAVAGASVLAWCEAWPIAPLDRAWADALVAHARPAAPSDVVVIDVDDDSLAAVGQWPWPRYRLAELLEHAAAAKPAAVALDVLLADADRTSLADMQARMQRDFDLDVSIAGVPSGLLDNDGYLGHTLARTGAIAGTYFFFDHASPGARPPARGVTFTGDLKLLEPDVATGVLEDAPGIAASPHASGFVNCLPDADGTLRRLPLVVDQQGTLYPSLALAAAARAVGASTVEVEGGRDGPVLRVGTRRIPVDARGRAWLTFPGSGWQDTLSAVDVLAGRFDPARLRGKTVFVGTSVVGLNDMVRTAIDPRLPGVRAHAAMAQTLLSDTGVTVPSWALAAETGAAALGAFLLLALHRRRQSTRRMVSIAAVLGLAWIFGGLALFVILQCIVSPALPLIVGGLACATWTGARQVALRQRALAWKGQLENERQVTIESMAAVAETRDPETGAHIKRTQYYVQAIARQLQREGREARTLTDEYIHLLFLSAPLHDVGKVGVPDHILLKPGKLDTSEMAQMKRHAEFGRQIIMSTARRIEGDNYLVIAGEIAATHHEKWDGTG
ncbi:MAG TPA: CHASE2 domain-containing protein, partial [Burkholderiaceae bacterium]|nr:CHASE2 domain-containing protein [Burkholderiaceae bacterium]